MVEKLIFLDFFKLISSFFAYIKYREENILMCYSNVN